MPFKDDGSLSDRGQMLIEAITRMEDRQARWQPWGERIDERQAATIEELRRLQDQVASLAEHLQEVCRAEAIIRRAQFGIPAAPPPRRRGGVQAVRAMVPVALLVAFVSFTTVPHHHPHLVLHERFLTRYSHTGGGRCGYIVAGQWRTSRTLPVPMYRTSSTR